MFGELLVHFQNVLGAFLLTMWRQTLSGLLDVLGTFRRRSLSTECLPNIERLHNVASRDVLGMFAGRMDVA